jgi:hypothetical protein
MYIIRIIAALFAVLLIAAPASADITARYAQWNGEPPMVVQASDSGESRVTVSEAVYVTTGGVNYMILDDAQGRFVIRQQDFLNLMADLLRATTAAAPTNAPAPAVAEGGTETLAGRAGTVFRLSDPRQPSDTFELVISTDPELAPLGRAIGSLVGVFGITMSRTAPGLGTAVSELVGRGTLLRFGPLWRLESVEVAPVPQSAFALPSAPLSPEALRARFHVDTPR